MNPVHTEAIILAVRNPAQDEILEEQNFVVDDANASHDLDPQQAVPTGQSFAVEDVNTSLSQPKIAKGSQLT